MMHTVPRYDLGVLVLYLRKSRQSDLMIVAGTLTNKMARRLEKCMTRAKIVSQWEVTPMVVDITIIRTP